MNSMRALTVIALGIGTVALIGYAFFPQYRTVIAEIVPFLFLLACPVAMYFMMGGMNTRSKEMRTHEEKE